MENNRKKYNIAMLVMTLIYVALVAVFIMGAYVITDGIGWDFVGAIFIAIFSVPFFVTVLSVVLLVSMRHLKIDKALPNQSFDVVIVRAAVLMMLLAAISGILFALSDTRIIRSALLTDITSNGIVYFAMLGIVAFQIYTCIQLLGFRKKAPFLINAVFFSILAYELISVIIISLMVNASAVKLVGTIIGLFIVYVPICAQNAVYFYKRKHLFVY